MRSATNVAVVGLLCALGTENGWPWAWLLWCGFAFVVLMSITCDDPTLR